MVNTTFTLVKVKSDASYWMAIFHGKMPTLGQRLRNTVNLSALSGDRRDISCLVEFLRKQSLHRMVGSTTCTRPETSRTPSEPRSRRSPAGAWKRKTSARG